MFFRLFCLAYAAFGVSQAFSYPLKAHSNIDLDEGLKVIFDRARAYLPGEENPRLVSEVQLWNAAEKSVWIKATYTWLYPGAGGAREKKKEAVRVTYIEPETAWIYCTYAPDEQVKDFTLRIEEATPGEIQKEKDKRLDELL